MRRRYEDERRGASPSVESAGIRALGSTVFVVLMALGGTASVRFQECSRAGDWDALEHDSQVEPEEASGRRARTASHQRFSAWFWHAIHSREILQVASGFIDAWNLSSPTKLFPLQFRYDSSCVQDVLLWPQLVQDFESASVGSLRTKPKPTSATAKRRFPQFSTVFHSFIRTGSC